MNLQRYLGFLYYYRSFIPRKAEKFNLFHKFLKAEVPMNITSELKESFDSVNKALSDACVLAMKQPIPGKQLVIMTDASFRNAVFALMIEDNPDQRSNQKEIHTQLSRFPQGATQDVNILKRIFGNLLGIS